MHLIKEPKCFFWQEGNCIVHSWWWCPICPWRIRKISGIDDVKSYLDFVHTRYSAKRSFVVSIFSVLIAAISTMVAFLVLLTNDKFVALLQEWIK
jgi:hypothetical protein